MNFKKKLGLLGATFLTAGAFGVAPAFAQDPADTCPPGTTQAADGTCEEEDEAIVVTGSRLRSTAFTSSSPVGVITAEEATLEGLANTAEIIQSTPATGGAFQVNTQLTGFVTTGGPGAQTIGLRGLGPERTLVLLNGHRLGPAGVRGTVGPIDLNTIPSSLIQRVEILKDGASSIYGSDAIAGVVNIITREDFDGLELNVHSQFNEWGGGEQHRINGSWGTTWTGGYFNIGAEYFEQEVLRNRDRDDTACAADYLFDPTTGERVDYPNLDPGQEYSDDTYKCLGLFARVLRAGTVNGTMDLIYEDPGVNYAVLGNNSPIAGMARQRRVGFPDTFPYAHMDDPAYGRTSAISPTETTSIVANLGFDIGDFAELYGELMFNSRESTQYGARQFFPTVNRATASNTLGAQLTGTTYLPIIPLASDRDQQIDYTRGLIGLRGDVGDTGWAWDVFAQVSRSDGEYGTDIIYNDRVLATTGRNATNSANNNSVASLAGCDQAIITISGGNCADLLAPIPWTSARILAGDFNANEREFLFEHEVGATTYDQRLVEVSFTGPAFELPAGSLEVAVGASYREEELDDQPGHNEANFNLWGSTSAGRTAGSDSVTEFFAEANVPLLADMPLFESLDLSLSGRLVEYDSYGEGDTYKVGLNWRVFPDFRIRASTGTSFRAPALFELYLADQSSFVGQANIDPCIDWQNSTNNILQQNCAADGVPFDYQVVGTSSATVFAGGGAGILRAEESEAQTLGLIWTPTILGLDGLSIAVDYFDIIVNDEITQFGSANILGACYGSNTGPAFGNTEPFCTLFTRNNVPGWTNPPGGTNHMIVTVDNNFVNVASQGNRGIDVNLRYERDIGPGELTLQGEATFILEDVTQIFLAGESDDFLGTTFNFRGPEIVARGLIRYDVNDWTMNWTMNYIGEGSDDAQFGGDVFPSTVYGQNVRFEQSVDPLVYHDFSVRKRFENENGADISLVLGLQNIFDERPPGQSTGQFRRGTAALNAYDLIGRRGFFTVSVGW